MAELVRASWSGDFVKVKSLISNGADANEPDEVM